MFPTTQLKHARRRHGWAPCAPLGGGCARLCLFKSAPHSWVTARSGELQIFAKWPALWPNGRERPIFSSAVFGSFQCAEFGWVALRTDRGQAVNYWAERYFQIESELKALRPFTSEDIDFKGGKQDVKRIAEQLQLKAVYPPKVAITALAGCIPFQIGDLKSNVEIVRTVPGISGSLDALAIEAELGGKIIRVLDPISLFACKLDLLATVSQERRRDLEHLRILVPCVRAFLREFLLRVEQNELPVRGWLGATNRVAKLTTSSRSRKIAEKFNIDWSDILPLREIVQSKHEKIIRFREHHLR